MFELARLGSYGSDMTIRLEERLSELEHRAAQLRLVADLAPAHIAHCSRDGLFLFANQSYAGRFGLTPDDIAGRHVAEVIGRRAWDVIQPYIERVLNGEQVEFEIEVPLQKIGP